LNASYPKLIFCRFTAFCNTRHPECWMRSQQYIRVRLNLISRGNCASSAALVFPCPTAWDVFSPTIISSSPATDTQYARTLPKDHRVLLLYKIASIAHHHPARMSGQLSSPETLKHQRRLKSLDNHQTDSECGLCYGRFPPRVQGLSVHERR
jgi:hypothetical protein